MNLNQLFFIAFLIAFISGFIKTLEKKNRGKKRKNEIFGFLSSMGNRTEAEDHGSFSADKYRKKDYFLTKAENEFYKKLLSFYSNKFIIIPQVNLDKLFFSNYSDRSRIDRKSVDFVFLDTLNFRPLLAIELDDPTHNREDRLDRDGKVNQLFAENNFTLIRMDSHSDIRGILDPYLI